MLRELAVHFREVRCAFETADRTLAGRFDRPLSSFVFPAPRFGEEEERVARKALTETNVAQPALGAAAVGLLDLLRALGIEPRMTAGHSYGEYAALCAAGCLTREQLFDLSESRGRFIVEAARGDLGTMAAIEADEPQTRALVGDIADLWIANLNSPRQTIVSGAKAAVSEALKRLEAREVAGQAIPVACAFHSPLVAPAKERLKEYLGNLRLEAPRTRVFANATGGEYPVDPDAIRAQLGEHLVSPVRFVSEIEAMYAAGARVFVEVGPRNVLTGLTDQILADRERVVVPLETRKRSGLEALLHALAQLAAHGIPVDLERLYEGRQPREHVVERLVEETREVAPPATAWWVDGSRATPVRAAAHASSEAPVSPSPGTKRQPTEITMNPTNSPRLTAVTVQGGNADRAAVLRTHEQVMQQLLDTHRRVMLAAIGKREAAPIQATPAAPVVAEPVAPSAMATDRSDTLHRPDEPPKIGGAEPIRTEVLRIVGERTGYPPDMLDVNADLEADLGIDSIKRVEIAGRLRKAFPHIGATADTSKVGNLASLRTLSALIERIVSASDEGSGAHGGGVKGEGAGREAPNSESRGPSSEADVSVPRFVMRMQEASARETPGGIRTDGVFLVTNDEKGLADAVAEAIVGLGGRAVVISAQPGGTNAGCHYQADFSKPDSLHRVVAAIRKAEGCVAGIVHLLPLRHRPPAAAASVELWRRTLQEEVKALFFLAQAAADDLKAPSPAGRARVLAAVESERVFSGHGGIAGLINTLATEWPELVGRTLALDTSEAIPALVERIREEIQDESPVRFVRYRNGQRHVARIEPAELDPRAGAQVRMERDWVIVLTGGGGGITAQVAIELAQRFQPTLVLTGRSEPPAAEEAPATRGVQSPEELRRILAGRLAGPGGKAPLAEIEAAYRRLQRDREIRATLAEIRGAGARGEYRQTDVRNEASCAALLGALYKEFGRLDGVIHGAGVIEDKRVEEKTPESFDRVFDTKADGAFLLAKHLRLDVLKFAVFFSSVACLGNAGQSDYAAANGVLNALARELDRRTPGRVVSVLWGPWQSAGMASEEVQRRFRERGVQVIPVAAGRRRLVEELLYGHKGEVEVLLGDAPYALAGAMARSPRASLPLIEGPQSVVHNNGGIEVACVLDPSRHAYLRDHMLDGKPVFPAAMAMELMAEAAWATAPAVGGGIEIASLEVQNGIVLADEGPVTLRVNGRRVASAAMGRNVAAFAMEIVTQEAARRAHYHGDVTLGIQSEPPHLDPSEFTGLDPFPLSVPQAYEQRLFQGPCFAGIAAIEGIRRDAIAGVLHGVAPTVCLPGALSSQWLLDPTVVDASLQLVILWERHWHDMTPLPMQIGRLRLFESLSGGPVRCLVKATAGDGGESLTADIYYTDAQGRVLAVLEGLQCACTKALNRLSGSTERRTDADRRGEGRLEATR
jgi:malonyl CoA-acyl carrier protein transacylase